MKMAEYIEREAVLKKLDKYGCATGSMLGHHSGAVDVVADVVYNFPAADVTEVRHGNWDKNRNCFVCGVYKFKGLDADVWADWDINYCPNCGAKMDEVTKENG